MSTLANKLSEISQEKQKILETEHQFKTQRRYEIGLLAEQCGILSMPNEEIFEAFKILVINHNSKQVNYV